MTNTNYFEKYGQEYIDLCIKEDKVYDNLIRLYFLLIIISVFSIISYYFLIPLSLVAIIVFFFQRKISHISKLMADIKAIFEVLDG